MSRDYNRKYKFEENMYSHASVAYKVEKYVDNYDIKEKEKKEKERQEKFNKIEEERFKKIFYKNRKIIAVDRSNKVLFITTVVVTAICGLLLLGNNDKNVKLRNDIAKQSEVLREQEVEIDSLKLELAHSYDIINIEQRAKEELHMSLPTPSQILYIELPKADYVTYAKVDEYEKNKYEVLIEKVGEVIR